MASQAMDTKAESPKAQWWLVAVLTWLSTLSYIDKNIVALMIAPIKSDLALSPTEVTIAIGSAFALANVLIVVPAGMLADRVDRRLIIWAAVTAWSIMTIACGAATGFWSLLLTRAGIGLAEGLLPPACYSLIRDRVSLSRRARALSIFSMGTLAGSGIAFLGGGLLLGFLSRSEMPAIPFLENVPPWGETLMLIGLTGFPLSLLVFTLRDGQRSTSSVKRDLPGLAAIFREMGLHRKTLSLLAVFSIANAMMANSNALWTVPLVEGRFGFPPSYIGAGIGLQLLTLGPIGLFAAGFIIDKLEPKTGRGTQTVALVVSLLLLVAYIMTPLASTITEFWFWQCLMVPISGIYFVVTANLVSRLLPANVTGRVIAFFLLLQGLIGVGLAPTLTALAIETVFASSDQPIAVAMSVIHGLYAAIAVMAAIFLFRQRLPAPLLTGSA